MPLTVADLMAALAQLPPLAFVEIECEVVIYREGDAPDVRRWAPATDTRWDGSRLTIEHGA